VTEAGWKRIARPDLGLELCYPDPTPSGRPVDRDDEPFRRHRRVHLSSTDRCELYVEVVRFDDLSPQDEYREHRAYLEERLGAGSVTELTETGVGGQTAPAYAFRWDEEGGSMERSVLLLTAAGVTYRVIFDPRSELNRRIVAGLTPAA